MIFDLYFNIYLVISQVFFFVVFISKHFYFSHLSYLSIYLLGLLFCGKISLWLLIPPSCKPSIYCDIPLVGDDSIDIPLVRGDCESGVCIPLVRGGD